jgi:hypothetical protein
MKIDKDAAPFDWNDPEKSVNDLAAQFLLQQVRDCLYNGAASDPKDCVVSRMTKALGLTGNDLDPCNAVIDDDQTYGQCIGEALGFEHRDRTHVTAGDRPSRLFCRASSRDR